MKLNWALMWSDWMCAWRGVLTEHLARPFVLLGLAVLSITPINGAIAQNQSGVLKWADVPEIHAYVTREYIIDPQQFSRENGRPFNTSAIEASKVELDSPADGNLEYIITIGDAGFCGSGGCSMDVIRISQDGSYTILGQFLAYSLMLDKGSINGMRYLQIQGKSGTFRLAFDGKYYKNADEVRQLPGAGVDATSKVIKRVACQGNAGWSGGPREDNGKPSGGASFRECRDPENYRIILRCQAGESHIEAWLALYLKTQGGQRIDVTFQVDGRSFVRSAQTRWDDMADSAQPIVRLEKTDPLLVALAKGNRLRVRLGRRKLNVPLRRSGLAIGAMLAACRQ